MKDWTKLTLKQFVGFVVLMAMSVAVEVIYYAVDSVTVRIGNYTMDVTLVAIAVLCIGTTIFAVNWLRDML